MRMICGVINPPSWIDLPAIVAGALAGALFAQRRGLDITCILALAPASGLGGGIRRDILVGELPPRMLRRGAPDASPAFLGTSLYIGLVDLLSLNKVIAQLSAVILVCLVRGVSVWRGWESPGSRDLTPTFLRSSGPGARHRPSVEREPTNQGSTDQGSR
jgi:uncharacterized membrane protein YeiH